MEAEWRFLAVLIASSQPIFLDWRGERAQVA